LTYLSSVREFLKKYRATLLFIVKFFAFYILGSLLYNAYLGLYPTELDPASCVITEQSTAFLDLFADDLRIVYEEGYPRADVYFQEYIMYYIIEGCNAISVMILFMAFVFAFRASWKSYLWFVPLGLLIIHLSNIARIAGLGWIFIHYYEYVRPFHDYVFPAIVYGTIMVLWFVWVKYVAR